MADAQGIDYCVAPESVKLWFNAFANLTAVDRVLYLGESSVVSESIETVIGCREGKRQTVLIFSSHASLLRDLDLASRLRTRELSVASQTLEATGLGIDKVALKKTLERIGVATPQWGELGSLESSRRGVLLKARNVTQSQGIHWYDGKEPTAPDDWYWEVYISGCEYSVLAFVDDSGTTLFPVIWKGHTRTDLLPPWRRPRMCPDPRLGLSLEARLLNAARAVLNFVKCWGFVELEFIVDPSGDVLLLEINPRVCGTMRIAAMACNTKIFSLPANRNRPELLAPTRQALEVPYDGVPFVSDDLQVVASSRITFAANSAAELLRLAMKHLRGRQHVLAQVVDLLNV
jgi:hypothetical protein